MTSANWPEVRLKWVARFKYGDALAADDRNPGDIPVMGSNGQFDTHDEANLRGPCLIVGRKGSHGKVTWSETSAWVTDTAYGIDQTISDADLRWLYYALQTVDLEQESQDTGVPGLSRDWAYQQRVPLPPLEEQRRIADYLDGETDSINELERKNDELVRLIDERVQSLIESRVFGVEDVARPQLRHVCEITPGYSFSSDDFLHDEGPVRLLRGVNIHPGRLDWSDVVYWPRSGLEDLSQYQLQPGDIVFGMDRPWISSGLRVARLTERDVPALLVQRVARLRPDQEVLDREYLFRTLQSLRFYAHFEPDMTGVSVPHVSGEQIGTFRLPVPDLKEQQAIARRLESELHVMRRLVEEAELQNGLLQERREALITAAVTGQIDVTTAGRAA